MIDIQAGLPRGLEKDLVEKDKELTRFVTRATCAMPLEVTEHGLLYVVWYVCAASLQYVAGTGVALGAPGSTLVRVCGVFRYVDLLVLLPPLFDSSRRQ